jgi:hypothetical protein
MRAQELQVGDRIRLMEGGSVYLVLKAGQGERFADVYGLMRQRLLVRAEAGGMAQDVFPEVGHEIEVLGA